MGNLLSVKEEEEEPKTATKASSNSARNGTSSTARVQQKKRQWSQCSVGGGGGEVRRMSAAHEGPVTNMGRLLNKSEQKQLQRIWGDLKRYHPDFTQNCWINVAHRSGKIRRLFEVDEGTTDSDMVQTRKMRKGIAGMQKFLETCIVDYGGDADRIEQAACELAQRHVNYCGDALITAPLWDIFALCLVEEFENTDNSSTNADHFRSVLVWRKFVHLIVNYMTDAYETSLADPNGSFDFIQFRFKQTGVF